MKRWYPQLIYSSILTAISAISFIACTHDSSPDDDQDQHIQVDTLKTLQSLQKLDDYPFFVMTYYGNYLSYTPDATEFPSAESAAGNRTRYTDRAWRCTGFAAFGDTAHPVFGRNFDWYNRACLLLFTDPALGLASVSMVDIHYCGYDDNPDFTSLESRIGLLQSPYMPFDGMNEAGVGISMMAVDDAQPPYDPGKRTLDDLGIIRLILDKAHSTVEAIALMSAHNISMQQVPLHYFIADKSGKSAVVEFVSNEMRVLYNTTNYQASTNFIFSKYKAPYIGLCNRYDYVYATLSDSSGYCSMVGAMTILQKASAGITMWSSVYELSTGQIDVVPGRKYGNTYRFTLRVM